LLSNLFACLVGIAFVSQTMTETISKEIDLGKSTATGALLVLERYPSLGYRLLLDGASLKVCLTGNKADVEGAERQLANISVYSVQIPIRTEIEFAGKVTPQPLMKAVPSETAYLSVTLPGNRIFSFQFKPWIVEGRPRVRLRITEGQLGPRLPGRSNQSPPVMRHGVEYRMPADISADSEIAFLSTGENAMKLVITDRLTGKAETFPLKPAWPEFSGLKLRVKMSLESL
jgi:hypothetical protein